MKEKHHAFQFYFIIWHFLNGLFNHGFWNQWIHNWKFEEFLQWKFEANAMHVVVQRLFQSFGILFMIGSFRIFMEQVVVRETFENRACANHSEFLGVFSNGTVNGHGELVPMSRMQQLIFEQLSHHLQRINGFLFGLRRETEH